MLKACIFSSLCWREANSSLLRTSTFSVTNHLFSYGGKVGFIMLCWQPYAFLHYFCVGHNQLFYFSLSNPGLNWALVHCKSFTNWATREALLDLLYKIWLANKGYSLDLSLNTVTPLIQVAALWGMYCYHSYFMREKNVTRNLTWSKMGIICP